TDQDPANRWMREQIIELSQQLERKMAKEREAEAEPEQARSRRTAPIPGAVPLPAPGRTARPRDPDIARASDAAHPGGPDRRVPGQGPRAGLASCTPSGGKYHSEAAR